MSHTQIDLTYQGLTSPWFPLNVVFVKQDKRIFIVPVIREKSEKTKWLKYSVEEKEKVLGMGEILVRKDLSPTFNIAQCIFIMNKKYWLQLMSVFLLFII